VPVVAVSPVPGHAAEGRQGNSAEAGAHFRMHLSRPRTLALRQCPCSFRCSLLCGPEAFAYTVDPTGLTIMLHPQGHAQLMPRSSLDVCIHSGLLRGG
jgi:hypothetical protein